MSSRGEQRTPSVFVHDFSPVNVDFERAAALFIDLLDPAVVAAHATAASQREGLGPVAPLGMIDTALGSPRWRSDAVLVPLRWFRQDEVGIELDADLELAKYVPGRCHLHLLGRVTLPDGMEPRTPASSLYGRQAVAIVRGALTGLADELATRASITAA